MKNSFTTLLIILGLLFSFQTYAQDISDYNKAKQYLDRKGEVYFHFNVQNPASLLELTSIISIDNVKNGEVWAYANSKEFAKFLEKNIPYEVLFHPGDVEVEMWDQSKGIWQFDTYPTYPEFETMMNTFATNYPNLCRIVQIGTTVDGRKLLFAVISDNVNTAEAEPKFMYTSSMHGDEATGYVTMLRLINYLLSNYATSPECQNLINNMEIWIMPLENPDGTYAGGDNTVTGATRENGNNVDINRNYKNPVGGLHPDGEVYQPETIAMMSFLDTMSFVCSGNFHGGAEVVNYPFDSWTSSGKTHADDAWWQYVSREFADTVHVYSPATYMDDLNNGITNGGDWYVIYGGRQDYETYYCRGREFTLEISNTKLVTGSSLPTYWNYLHRSLISYMQQALYGFKGTITDGCTGNPIRAKVFVNSHDRDSSHTYSTLPFGNYYRPIKGGTWSVTFSASGYQSVTQNVTVTDMNSTTVNVTLVPIAPTANFSADHTTGCNATVQFTDISGAPAGTTFLWNFGDGQTSTLQNPSHSYSASGTYTVTLTLTSCAGNDSEIKTNYITISLPTAPTTTSAERCGTGTVALSASGTGTLNWYNAASGGSIVNTGTNYTTPSLTSSTTYYVESYTSSYGASQYVPSPTITSALTYNTNRYQIFTVNTPIKLVSVQVRTTIAGNRTVELRNSGGTVLQSAVINIPTGTNRITLNWDIPAGTDYQIGLATGSAVNLFRHNTGVTYPYEIDGLVSITNSSAGTTAYYFYYDWEVQELSSCTSARVPVTATIKPVPTANAGSDQEICNGNSATLTATGGGTYLWTGGSTNASITVSPTINTTYTVTVTNAQSCTATDQVLVTVNSLPSANAGTDQAICNGSPATLTATGGGTYLWTGGSTNASITVYPTTNTTYTVTVTNAQNCTATDNVVVTVNTNPIADAGTDESMAAGTTTLYGSASGGSGSYTYHWEPAAQLVNANVASPTTVSLSSTTQFTLTTTDQLTGCTGTDIVIITITGGILSATISATPSAICVGNSTQLEVLPSGGSGTYTYTWASNPAGFNSSISNPTVSPTVNTTYYVTVSDGSTTTNISTNVTVNSLPNAQAGNDQTICEGQVATLTASGGDTYEWNVGDNTSQIFVSPSSTTTYAVTVTNANGCTNTDFVTVNVNQLPVSNFNYSTNNLNITFTNLSTGATSYMWYFGDGGLSSQTNPNYNYALEGTYNVMLIAHNTCGNDTLIQSITVSVSGIKDSENELISLLVYPNPSNGFIIIQSLSVKPAEISIHDVTGRTIFINTIENKINPIDISFLSDGLYYLQFTSEKGRQNIPIVIAH